MGTGLTPDIQAAPLSGSIRTVWCKSCGRSSPFRQFSGLFTDGHISRVETDSPKYSWLNQVDFIAPGAFNGTEVMTVNHYFPNVSLGCIFMVAEIDHLLTVTQSASWLAQLNQSLETIIVQRT